MSLFSCSAVSDSATPWTAARQASLSITNSRSLLRLMPIESAMPSTVSSSVVPFSSCPQSFPASGSFPTSRLFASGSQSIGASASASAPVLPMNIQSWFPLEWTGLISPRDSQESPLAPQFESINSLVLSHLHSPILTSIPDHRKWPWLDRT